MSEFYGTLEGNRGVATRCGTASSGIKASVQSWDGSVQMRLCYDVDGEQALRVSMSNGSSFYGDTVFDGSLERFRAMCEKEMGWRR